MTFPQYRFTLLYVADEYTEQVQLRLTKEDRDRMEWLARQKGLALSVWIRMVAKEAAAKSQQQSHD